MEGKRPGLEEGARGQMWHFVHHGRFAGGECDLHISIFCVSTANFVDAVNQQTLRSSEYYTFMQKRLYRVSGFYTKVH